MSETDDEFGLDLFAEVQAAGSGCASEPPPQLPQVPQLPQPAPAAGVAGAYAECALVLQPPVGRGCVALCGGGGSGAGYRRRKQSAVVRLTPKQASAIKAGVARQRHLAKKRTSGLKAAVRTSYEAGHANARLRGVRKVNVNKKSFAVTTFLLRGNQLSTSDKLIAMFGAISKDSAVSLRLGIHGRTVQRMKALGAAAVMRMQLQLLQLLMHRAKRFKLEVFAQRLCWDETKFKMALVPPSSGLTAQQCIGSWSVLVQKRRFLALSGDASASYMSVVVPPAFLSSTGGAYVYTGLFTHTKLVGEISKFCVDMALQAEYSFLALGADGAFSNEKLIAYIINTTEEDYLEGRGREACGGFQLVSASLCGNHRTNLVEASSFLYIDDCLHGDLFCATLFLATTGMFLRICLAAKVLVAEAEMKRCPAPSGLQEEFKVEFAQFLLDAKMSEWEHARLMPSASKAKRHKVEESEDGHAPPELDLREWHSRAKLGEPLDDIAKSADTRIHKAVVQYARLLIQFV